MGDVELIDTSITQFIAYHQSKIWIARQEQNTVQVCDYPSGQAHTSYDFKYARAFHDLKGQLLVSLSNNTRRSERLVLIKDDKETSFDHLLESLDVNTIRDIYAEDFERDMLIGTWNGLYYLSHKNPMIQTNLSRKLESDQFGNVMWWIIQRENGKIYTAKESRGIYELRADSIIPIKSEGLDLLRGNYFAYYHQSSDQTISLSVNNAKDHLNFWDFKNQPTQVATDQRYYDFVEMEGDLLLAVGTDRTRVALALIDMGTRAILDTMTVAATGKTAYSVIRHDDQFVLGTNTGVYSLKITETNSKLLVQNSTQLTDHDVLDIEKTSAGFLVATYGAGLHHIDRLGNSLKSVTTAHGLPSNVIHTIRSDHKGNYWVSGQIGLAILDSNLNILRTISTNDGLSSNECNSGGMLLSDDFCYVSTINGIQMINQEIINDLRPSRKITLDEAIYLNDQSARNSIDLSGSKIVDIPSGIDDITITFDTWDLNRSPSDQQEKYTNLFSSTDPNLEILFDDRKLFISKLRRGQNKLEWRRLINEDSDNTGSQEIIIKRETLMQKYGLATALGLILFLALGRLYRARLQQEESKRAFKEQELNLRMSSLKLEALKSHMNPHFIYNALSSVQYFIQKKETDEADEFLTDFALLMRKILNASTEERISLQDEISLLRLYLTLEQKRMDYSFDFDITTDETLDQDMQLPPMLLQPVVENAILHGIYHLKDRKGNIDIHFTEVDELTTAISIRDNGVGRIKSAALRTSTHSSKASNILKERIKLINSGPDFRLSLDMIDHTDHEITLGTEVVIRISENLTKI